MRAESRQERYAMENLQNCAQPTNSRDRQLSRTSASAWPNFSHPRRRSLVKLCCLHWLLYAVIILLGTSLSAYSGLKPHMPGDSSKAEKKGTWAQLAGRGVTSAGEPVADATASIENLETREKR